MLLQALYEREPDSRAHALRCVAVSRDRPASRAPEPRVRRARSGAPAPRHRQDRGSGPRSSASPGTLDDDEWALIRQHTLVGERILAVSPALRRIAELVRSSHERWDGTGYPDQLAGEQIPFAARVILVCDAFDAMTERRAYRDRLEPEAALAELRRCAGTQFDAEIVDLFAELICPSLAKTPVGVTNAR